MTAVTWIWTHGASGCVDFPADFPEFPGPPAQVQHRPLTRDGSGLTISPQMASSHVILLPITGTPLLDDVFMRVAGFALLFDTTDAVINSVTLLDGAKQIASFGALGWSGAHPSRDNANTLNLPAEVEISGAILAVVEATFAQSSNPQSGALTGSVRIIAGGIRLSAGETRLERWFRNVASVFSGR